MERRKEDFDVYKEERNDMFEVLLEDVCLLSFNLSRQVPKPVREFLTSEGYVYKKKLAKKDMRYDDSLMFMDKLVDRRLTWSSDYLFASQSELINLAYVNVLGALRISMKVVSSIEMKDNNEEQRVILSKVESENMQPASAILKTLDSIFSTILLNEESDVFRWKMKGDFYSCLAEFKVGADWKKVSDDAISAYHAGQVIALSKLDATHPLRLELALNLSNLHGHILNSPDDACFVVKEVLIDAITELEGGIKKESYEKIAGIFQSLRNNLNVWNKAAMAVPIKIGIGYCFFY